MKKILLFVLVALLLCGSATIASANLIQNSSFENWTGDPANFDNWIEGAGVDVDSYAHTGSYSAFLDIRSAVKAKFNYGEAGTYEYGAYFTFFTEGEPPDVGPYDRPGATATVYWPNPVPPYYPIGEHHATIVNIGSGLATSWTNLVGTNIWRSDWYLIMGTFDLPAAGAGLQGELNIYLQEYAGVSTSLVDDAFVRRVPEPATMFLLGTGLLGMAVLGRKRLLKK